MSTINQRRDSKERFWRMTVRRWRGSGLSVRAYCEQHELAEPTFYAWRRSIQERDAAAVRFVPVQVVPETPAESSSGALELVVGAGRRLRVGPGFDAPTLRRLLALLEEGRP
jgi:transposase-like protein